MKTPASFQLVIITIFFPSLSIFSATISYFLNIFLITFLLSVKHTFSFFVISVKRDGDGEVLSTR